MQFVMKLLSTMAPKGQAAEHCPQRVHFSSSISEMPSSRGWIALILQADSQGRLLLTIAPNWQAFAQSPQLTQRFLSMRQRKSEPKLIALRWQAWAQR